MSLISTIMVDRSSPKPLTQQIYEQLELAIKNGQILFGSRLPSIRDLSLQLKVNKIAAVTAYERLCDEGLVVSRPGSGFFAAQKARKTPLAATSQTANLVAPIALEPSQFSSQWFNRRFLPLDAVKHESHAPLGGSHAPADQIPFDELRSAARHVLMESSALNLTYEHPQGLLELRERIAGELEIRNILLTGSSQVLITSGALQALNLALNALCQPGDTVAVEVPSLSLLFPILARRKLKLLEMNRDFEGINLTSELENDFKRLKPKVFVVTPDFHNPTGGTLSLVQRHKLLRYAEELGAMIIELDVFHGLQFGDTITPPISALDGLKNTIHISSYSKTLASGLRIGHIAASQELIQKMTEIKTLSEISGSSLDQSIVSELLKRGFMRKHLLKVRDVYRGRRDTLNAMLRKLSPQGSQWNMPEGGLFMWFAFPEQGPVPSEIDAWALDRKVLLAPGCLFYPEGRASHHMRINYALLEPVTTYRALETVFGLWRAAASRRWKK